MLENLSEDIVFRLIRLKILDVEKGDIYRYGMQVLLLNGSILLSMLGISLLTGTVVHYFFFLMAFCPLRMMAGGYHAKTPAKCFLYSNGLYLLTVVMKYLGTEYQVGYLWHIAVIVSAIGIFAAGPLERTGVYISERKHKKHKIWMCIFLGADIVLFILLYITRISYWDTVALALLSVKVLQRRFT